MATVDSSINRGAKIVQFTDLVAWQKAHKLYVGVHETTKTFPSDEKYGLTDQIRRAALSVTSNIAEGFGRSTDNDTVHFYFMARGSLYEVMNQLIAARDIGVLEKTGFDSLYKESQEAKRILIGLINSTKKRN